jgi:hypothetical protein
MERFKAGDKVFDIRYGWGKVGRVATDDYVYVFFDDISLWYRGEGSRILSFTEYALQGFTAERLEPNWDSIYKDWSNDGSDLKYREYLAINFEPPVRKCK